MADMRSKLDLLYQEVLGEVADIVQRVEALQKGIPQATAALQSAAAAAGAVKTAVEQVPDVILKQTAAAGDDLKQQVAVAGTLIINTAGEKADQVKAGLTAAIAQAAQASATVINQAVAGLGAAAESRTEELTREMQAAVAIAARDQIRAGLAGKMARSWSVVAGSLAFALLLGAGMGIEAQYLDGKVLPWGWHTVRTGAGECGHVQIVIKGVAGPVLRTIEVCGATPD
ncbi:MAG: hypothetical protein ACYDDA_09265 [Acidiferrobacteraceae bacterium]